LHGVRLGRVVADRVVGEDLAVRQQRDVHADHWPAHDGAPLADVLRSPRDGGGRCIRVGRADGACVGVECSLEPGRERDSIFGRVARGGKDIVRSGAWRSERDDGDRRDEGDAKSGQEARPSSSTDRPDSMGGKRLFLLA
jgi:hypothetical protein